MLIYMRFSRRKQQTNWQDGSFEVIAPSFVIVQRIKHTVRSERLFGSLLLRRASPLANRLALPWDILSLAYTSQYVPSRSEASRCLLSLTQHRTDGPLKWKTQFPDEIVSLLLQPTHSAGSIAVTLSVRTPLSRGQHATAYGRPLTDILLHLNPTHY